MARFLILTNRFFYIKLYFFQKKVLEKYVCLPYLNFQTRYPKQTYSFIWHYRNIAKLHLESN